MRINIFLSLLIFVQVYITTGVGISYERFKKIVLCHSGHEPDYETYGFFDKYTYRFDSNERHMFLAHLIHDSNGFQITEKPQYSEYNPDSIERCPISYHQPWIGVSNKSYHGRGYILLCWPENYRDASQDLFGNLTLLLEPELLATDKNLAMRVSVWYWLKYVSPIIQSEAINNNNRFKFGTTTNILSNMRCTNECIMHKPTKSAVNRLKIYRDIFTGNKNNRGRFYARASEFGCYS